MFPITLQKFPVVVTKVPLVTKVSYLGYKSSLSRYKSALFSLQKCPFLWLPLPLSLSLSLSLQKLLFLSTLQNLKFSDGVVWLVFKKKALKGLVSSPFFQCSVTVFCFILGNKMFLEDKMIIYINSSN